MCLCGLLNCSSETIDLKFSCVCFLDFFRCEDDGKPMAKPYKFSNQRLKDLGLEFTPLRKSLHEAVLCMQQKSHLPLIYPVPKRAYL